MRLLLRVPRALNPRTVTPRSALTPPALASHSRTYASKQPPIDPSAVASAAAALNPRWLSDLKARIGKCITFGLHQEQVTEAGAICAVLGQEWRELVAGAEGYLTDPGRRGLWGHAVVWGDQDSMGHVNNVTYNRYAESARINWASNYAKHLDPTHASHWANLWTPSGQGLILKSITTDFKFPLTYPDRITVLHKLRAQPKPHSSAFTLSCIVLSEKHQRLAARCEEVIVLYDYVKGRKSGMPDFMLSAFETTWDLQEKRREEVLERVRGLTERVRELERGSWDREGAVEDMGSAKG
ncbi:hypothetical protein EJ06DRAFT_530848 [Trichodelitschia bisporula]|uniref:Thioesterase/thiol ester dehydrase-isomerase n=1 Tax=Trichodelitschia bisporula TaxID=703511 RepID=A0A6G1HVK4_9PEZI|nr:hypothetical protein EJ06DRAFT_530848 [Trichodelitschia bisporula]